MINEAELRQMSVSERHQLARMLATIDYPHPLLDLNLKRRARLRVGMEKLSRVCILR